MEKLSFNRLFTERELAEIRGQKNRNFLILVSILVGTFMAITIADGGLDYLRMKMSDPFVKNLDVTIPFEISDRIPTYKYSLNQDSIRERFLFDTVMTHVELALGFWDLKELDYTYEKGRSIEYGNPILQQILHKSNLLHGRGFSDVFDYGLIVTRKLLKDHNYPLESHFIHMAVPRPDEGYFQVPLPIIAVVEELPGLSNFAFTPYFFGSRNSGWENPFMIDQYHALDLFFPGNDTAKITRIDKALSAFVKSSESVKDLDPFVEQSRYEYTYENGTLFSLSFYPGPSEEKLQSILLEMTESVELRKQMKNLERIYFYRMPGTQAMELEWDKMSFMFSKLNHVAEFKNYLYEKYDLEVEMSKVRDKENFVAISVLTITMAVILLLFSVFSVALFVYNLLRNHLSKITMNLGTFKAFGMSNQEIKQIYRGIIRKFCLSGIGIALGIVFLIDLIVVLVFLRDLNAWHMLNIYTLIAILAIIGSVEWTVKITSNAILEHSPGDLIYGRDKN